MCFQLEKEEEMYYRSLLKQNQRTYKEEISISLSLSHSVIRCVKSVDNQYDMANGIYFGVIWHKM